MTSWPKSVPNPTWHDHFYGGTTHSEIGDEEHHRAVDALCDRIEALETQLVEAERRYEELQKAAQEFHDSVRDAYQIGWQSGPDGSYKLQGGPGGWVKWVVFVETLARLLEAPEE